MAKSIRKTFLGRTSDGLRAYKVSGKSLRDKDPSFCLGTHYLVRRYVPKGEIWVESTGSKTDEYATLGHEIHEVRSMRDKALPFSKAHERALRFEKKLRKSKGSRAYIRKELR